MPSLKANDFLTGFIANLGRLHKSVGMEGSLHPHKHYNNSLQPVDNRRYGRWRGLPGCRGLPRGAAGGDESILLMLFAVLPGLAAGFFQLGFEERDFGADQFTVFLPGSNGML